MSYYYTSDDLIASLKRRIIVPTSQSTFTEQDFLDFATEEMNMALVQSVMQLQEDYYLDTVELPIIQNKSKYAIPYRAIGNKLKDVAFKDANGNVQEMTRIGVEDLPFYNGSSGRVHAYYMSSNEICLALGANNTVNPGGSLLVSYYLRPNSLVPLKEIAIVSSIDRTTGIIQLDNFPELFNQTKELDLIMYKSPHKILKYDILSTAMNSTNKTITLNLADIPDNLSKGDHIALATQTAIPQLPSDLHVILAHRMAARILEALGDTEGLQNANQKLAEMEQKTTVVIDDRVEAASRKVVNRHSILRAGLRKRRFR